MGEIVLKIVFVAGTGTAVGKTYVAQALARAMLRAGIRVGVYKPVASGCIPVEVPSRSDSTLVSSGLLSNDASELWKAAGRPLNLDAVCPQRFVAELAPDQAARREGKAIDVDLLFRGALAWQDHCDTLIIEGAGGLFSPLAGDLLNVDLFLKCPAAELVLVAANRLGAIHEVIATSRAAEQAEATVSRLYLSASGPEGDQASHTNAQEIQKWCPALEVHQVTWNGTVRLG